jgi:spore maturation protein CgeB
MKIALVFNKDRPDTTGLYVARALRRSLHKVDHFWTRHAEKIAPVYDLYLRIDHGDYKYDIPQHLKPSAFYAIDTHLPKPFKRIQEQARHYDFVFCAQKEAVAQLRRAANISAHWIPVACDPEIHRPLPVAKRFDFGFVGTNGKNNPRSDYLDQIRREYPKNFVGRTPFSRMSRVYSRSKIGFNYSIHNDVNMRMFEALACRTLLLTNQLNENGLEDLFEVGTHLVTYKDKNEFSELAKKYLADEVAREAIADAGYRWVISKHTYRHRVARMLDIVRRGILIKYARLSL